MIIYFTGTGNSRHLAKKVEEAINEIPVNSFEYIKAVSYTHLDVYKRQVKISMLSVGDNLIHDGIYEQAKKRSKNGVYDFSYAYKNIASTVEKADLATINQETIIAKSYDPSGYPLFNSPQAVGEEVKKIGFDVVKDVYKRQRPYIGSHVSPK